MSIFTNLNAGDRSSEISRVTNLLNSAGIDIPAREKPEYFQHPGTPSIKAMALEEVANGRDPLDSEAIQKALLRIKLDEVFHQYNEVNALEARETFQHHVKHFDLITQQFVEQFNTNVDIMRDIMAKHPKLNISDSMPGGDLLIPYAHAVEANHKAESAAKGLGVCRLILKPAAAEPGVYWYLNPTWDQVKAHNFRQDEGARLSLWDTLKAGIEVEYAPSYQVAKGRADAIAKKRDEERRRRAEEKERNGFGL